jgi:hypothetical protein
MPRPQSKKAQQGRALDKLMKVAPRLPDEDMKLLEELRASLVADVAASAEGKRAAKATDAAGKANAERPLAGRAKGG